jgi:hypothetical protein
LVSEEIGYSRASIYIWRKKYILKGATALMNVSDDPRGKLPESEPASTEEMEKLKSQMQDMQLEIDILKETLEVLKKDPGVDKTTLRYYHTFNHILLYIFNISRWMLHYTLLPQNSKDSVPPPPNQTRTSVS